MPQRRKIDAALTAASSICTRRRSSHCSMIPSSSIGASYCHALAPRLNHAQVTHGLNMPESFIGEHVNSAPGLAGLQPQYPMNAEAIFNE